MEIEEVLTQAQDAIAASRVYGTPYERDGVTVIPAATLRGGLGAGRGEHPEQNKNSGGGFGLTARPAGVYVIRNGEVTWQPAIDANRLLLVAAVVGGFALLALGRMAASVAVRRDRPLSRGLRWLMRSRRFRRWDD